MRRLLVTAALLSACGGPTPPAPAPAAPPAADASAEDAAPPPAAAPDAAAPMDAGRAGDAGPPRHCDTMRWVPGYCYVIGEALRGGAAEPEPRAWLEARRAPAAAIAAFESTIAGGAACSAISVGATPIEALVCVYIAQVRSPSDRAVYRGVQRARVVAPRAGRLDVLLDAPVGLENFDGGPPPPSLGGPRRAAELALLALSVDATSSTSVTLAEPRAGACAEAKRILDEHVPTERKGMSRIERLMHELDRRLLAEVCASVGTYALDGAQLRRRR